MKPGIEMHFLKFCISICIYLYFYLQSASKTKLEMYLCQVNATRLANVLRLACRSKSRIYVGRQLRSFEESRRNMKTVERKYEESWMGCEKSWEKLISVIGLQFASWYKCIENRANSQLQLVRSWLKTLEQLNSESRAADPQKLSAHSLTIAQIQPLDTFKSHPPKPKSDRVLWIYTMSDRMLVSLPPIVPCAFSWPQICSVFCPWIPAVDENEWWNLGGAPPSVCKCVTASLSCQFCTSSQTILFSPTRPTSYHP